MKRGLLAMAGVALLASFAADGCSAIVPQTAASPPVNACPDHPCAAYGQTGPAASCMAGACAVEGTPRSLLLVIGLPTDSIFAPGRTYLTTLDRGVPESGPCALQDCSPPTCALSLVLDANSYLFDEATANEVGWDLGNPKKYTALPAHATYRPLLGSSMTDAIDVGLPLDPVQASVVAIPPPVSYEGPDGSPPSKFQAYMESGCYERTIQPDAPFSSAFPPEIKPWNAMITAPDEVTSLDRTSEETGLPMGLMTTVPPTFQIARAEGLDGWTAYLRSIETKRIFSNVAPLSGSLAKNVALATNHLTGQGDALDGLELVVAPPPGTPLPTEVLAPAGGPQSKELPAAEVYPSLPVAISVSGSITTSEGTPAAATLVFVATDVFDRTGNAYPPNFEFVTRVATQRDARTGASLYSVVLPQGDYAVAITPSDGSSALTTTSVRVLVGQGSAISGQDMVVGSRVRVSGRAKVADGRLLNNAVVDALPTQCEASVDAGVDSSGVSTREAGADSNRDAMRLPPDASTTESVAEAPTSGACMPRPAETTTAPDGSFSLALDPGGYLLRVRPAPGSRLPWVSRTFTALVASPPVTLEPIFVPAPVRIAMTVTDTRGTAIADAVVRIFTDPRNASTPATNPVELGRAITDVSGNYEIMLAPPVP